MRILLRFLSLTAPAFVTLAAPGLTQRLKVTQPREGATIDFQTLIGTWMSVDIWLGGK